MLGCLFVVICSLRLLKETVHKIYIGLQLRNMVYFEGLFFIYLSIPVAASALWCNCADQPALIVTRGALQHKIDRGGFRDRKIEEEKTRGRFHKIRE